MRRFLVAGLVLAVISGCVPNRKVVYLQKDDLHKKDVVLDSVVRTHDLRIYEYRIQPLDILSIRFESLTEEDFDFVTRLYPNVQQTTSGGNAGSQLINGFVVDNNGDIEFPVAGKIHLAGLTIFQASQTMQDVFRPFLKNPVARVRLLNFRFTVLGEVNLENQIVSNNTRVTIMEAIGLAGGLTDLADRSKVKVVRQKGNQSEILYLNLLDEDLLTSDHYYVHQNDMIVVPALKQRPFQKFFGQNLALIVSSVTLIVLLISLTQ